VKSTVKENFEKQVVNFVLRKHPAYFYQTGKIRQV